VLNKPGPLSDDEWELMRAHPAGGRSILDGIAFLEVPREIVYCHHERWDGEGYPRGCGTRRSPSGRAPSRSAMPLTP
jgi:putative two-component system response regulator